MKRYKGRRILTAGRGFGLLLAKCGVRILLLACGFSLLLAGCGYAGGNAREGDSDSVAVVRIPDPEAEDAALADSLLRDMSLEEKAAQVFMPAVFASDDIYTRRLVGRYAEAGVGGLVLLKGDTAGAVALGDTMRTGGRITPFMAIDAEWGLAMRLVDAPRFPANGEISSKAGETLMYDYGREMARECRALGINMVLGPVVDVVDSTRGGLPGRRSFGGNAERVGDLALAYARGLEDGNVIGVAKHFPGHGAAPEDSHRRKGVINESLEALQKRDLVPFREWIGMGLSGIMVGHLAVPAIDPGMTPAALSRIVIEGLLREDLGFRGLVLTDALNMAGAEGRRPVEALKAGADIIVAPADTWDGIAEVAQAVETGLLPEWRLDEAVGRILRYKIRFSDIPREPSDSLMNGRVQELARKLAGGE